VPITFSNRIKTFCYSQRTAIPIFLTLDSRAASLGSRFSMMVSCARLSGSACASSNLAFCKHPKTSRHYGTHIAAAAAAAPRLCCHRRSNGHCCSEAEGLTSAVEAHRREPGDSNWEFLDGLASLSSARTEPRDNRDARMSAREEVDLLVESSTRNQNFWSRDPRFCL
jgi:hypothetical protein